MTRRLLPRRSADDLGSCRRSAVDAGALGVADGIVADVRARGERAVREHAERLGDISPGEPLVLDRGAMRRALDAVTRERRGVLERAAGRIESFARAQRACLTDCERDVPGGRAGHTVRAVDRAGCYAPGGRFPLPSSVLMTAVTARAAGVRDVWVASPRPGNDVLAAAGIAGADGLLAVGGAQAIGAFAYGAGQVPRCDIIVGPGNRWVTAAKKSVAGDVGIDMFAGPSELVVIADDSADAAIVAADLLAQAEHDPDARPILLTTSEALADGVEAQLADQLRSLPTARIAEEALGNGAAVVCASIGEAARVSDAVAPEHLEIMTRDAARDAERVSNYGAVFIGSASAEVFGDYGAGPNHVLPTGGSARFAGGLSVLTFLRVRTWLRMNVAPGAFAAETAAFARIEALEGHARAAERRSN